MKAKEKQEMIKDRLIIVLIFFLLLLMVFISWFVHHAFNQSQLQEQDFCEDFGIYENGYCYVEEKYGTYTQYVITRLNDKWVLVR